MNKIKEDRMRVIGSGLYVGAFLAALMLVSSGSLMAQMGSSGRGMPGGKPQTEAPKYRPPVIESRGTGEKVVAVHVVGNREITEDRIRPHLQTQAGRNYDPELVQADVRTLSTRGWFRNVRTYRKPVKGGLEITYEVFELPIIRHVRFIGNKKVRDRTLLKRSELKEGEALQRFSVEEARRRLQELYKEKGYTSAEVEIKEGIGPDDHGVVFAIHEGELQRIFKTKFVGNKEIGSSRLKVQVKSKPGILYYFKGQVDKDQIDADVDRLTSYYRGLGFFNAQVSRAIDEGSSGKWIQVTFVVNEGPRFKIRNATVVGNDAFTNESLMSQLELTDGGFFDATRMNRDLNSLRDAYGSQGYIHADIKAEPRFLEQPGLLDLVYDIAEGDQYRVGKITVNIEGENPHTRRDVVLNRISVSPGDLIDSRELRASERRLRSSQLFLSDPTRGAMPTIAVKPPELSTETRFARQPDAQDRRPSRSPGSPY